MNGIALVLASGGARGLAHIGVIQSIESHGLKISSIAGSSIGAVVGGVYASGHLNEYTDWVSKLDQLDVFSLMDFTFSTNGFLKGEKVFLEMKKFIADTDIELLKIPFKAIATDMTNGTEVVFDKGSLFTALSASAAIPMVVKPVIDNDRYLVDGGVTNPLPVDHIDRIEGDLLMAVNINAPIPYEKTSLPKKRQNYFSIINDSRLSGFVKAFERHFPDKKSKAEKYGYFDLMLRSFDLMQDKLTNMQIQNAKPDILVEISRKACGTMDFYRAEEMIEVGRKAADKVLDNCDLLKK